MANEASVATTTYRRVTFDEDTDAFVYQGLGSAPSFSSLYLAASQFSRRPFEAGPSSKISDRLASPKRGVSPEFAALFQEISRFAPARKRLQNRVASLVEQRFLAPSGPTPATANPPPARTRVVEPDAPKPKIVPVAVPDLKTPITVNPKQTQVEAPPTTTLSMPSTQSSTLKDSQQTPKQQEEAIQGEPKKVTFFFEPSEPVVVAPSDPAPTLSTMLPSTLEGQQKLVLMEAETETEVETETDESHPPIQDKPAAKPDSVPHSSSPTISSKPQLDDSGINEPSSSPIRASDEQESPSDEPLLTHSTKMPPSSSTHEFLEERRASLVSTEDDEPDLPSESETDGDASIISRGRSVRGRQGSVQKLLQLHSDAVQAKKDRLHNPAEEEKVVLEGDEFRSRTGTLAGVQGMVGHNKKRFLEKARRLTTPLSLAEKLKEVEAEMGAREELGGKIVVYTTSLGTVRETYSACLEVRKIFQFHRVAFEERDVHFSAAFAKELEERKPGATPPQVFFNGRCLGGLEVISYLNETDKLAELIQFMPRIENNSSGLCGQCLGKQFIPCLWCGGDRKSIMSRFGREIVALKCTCCNENGLMRCTACLQS